MSTREAKFNQVLRRFPDAARSFLQSIPNKGGKLSGTDTKRLLDIMNVNVEELMIQLLPMAGIWAVAPISGFQVGAVAGSLDAAIYFGANFEFTGLPLNQTIHAEQAAVMNAWHQGVTQIHSIAVSAAPCGHCRQFLNELNQNQDLEILIVPRGNQAYQIMKLTDLLPEAFGPFDLKKVCGLAAPSEKPVKLKLERPSDDPLIVKALEAAESSYAPYTGNYAGCAIVSSDNKLYTGRYAENAAFNPGISPLQSAVACMNLTTSSDGLKIHRAVLVEHPSKCVQKGVTKLVLASLAPGVSLEYHKAKRIG